MVHGKNCLCFVSTKTNRGQKIPRDLNPTEQNQAIKQAGMGCKNMTEVRPVFHALLSRHEKIKRRVEAIPQGIRSETTSENPQVAELIRNHVRQMQIRIEQCEPLRIWDPLFQEIFRHAEKIQMKVEEIPGGVRVTETSADPQVQKLIRLHAQVVGRFVKAGFEATSEPHEIPKDGQAGSGKKSSL